MLKDDHLLQLIENDWTTAGIDARRTAMLSYAIKLTGEPGNVGREDITALRNAGLSDRDILDLCEVTAYYAYVNRIADGLGVELEDWVSDE